MRSVCKFEVKKKKGITNHSNCSGHRNTKYGVHGNGITKISPNYKDDNSLRMKEIDILIINVLRVEGDSHRETQSILFNVSKHIMSYTSSKKIQEGMK